MDPFVAEIRIFCGSFAPRGWAICNGQLLPISQNTALFSLLGTTYGGDGIATFALPDLRGRAPMAWGQASGLSDRFIGESLGEETATLTEGQMPLHSHTLTGIANATQANPDAFHGLGNAAIYAAPGGGATVAMAAGAIGATGGSQPHNNRQPYLAMNFIIALQGFYPPRP